MCQKTFGARIPGSYGKLASVVEQTSASIEETIASVGQAYDKNGRVRAHAKEAGTRRDEQTVEIGHEKRRAGTGSGLERLKAAIAAPILLPDIHASSPAGHIDAAPPAVEKHIVRVPTGGESADRFSGVRIEQDETRRIAEDHSYRAARSIERHRVIGAQIRHLPSAYLPANLQVHDRDLVGIGHVDECPAPFGIQLKSFG